MATLQRRSREWNDIAPVRIEAVRDIDASAADVFAVLADHEAWPQWFDALAEVEVTGARSGIGGQRRVKLKPSGVFNEEFYAWEEGREFGFSILESSLPLLAAANELITIDERAEGGVTVTYVQALEPKRWAAPLVKLGRGRLQRGLDDGLAGLAARVEG